MSNVDLAERRKQRLERRVEEHEEALDHHDRRISKNENWRLQAQGALKILAITLGSGLLAYVADALAIFP